MQLGAYWQASPPHAPWHTHWPSWHAPFPLQLSGHSRLLGIAIGSRHFLKAQPESFRRFTLSLLIFLALLGLVRTVLI